MYTKLNETAQTYTRFTVHHDGGLVVQVLTVAQEVRLTPGEAARVREQLPTGNPFFGLDEGPKKLWKAIGDLEQELDFDDL